MASFGILCAVLLGLGSAEGAQSENLVIQDIRIVGAEIGTVAPPSDIVTKNGVVVEISSPGQEIPEAAVFDA